MATQATPAPVILADLCGENSDLKNDAIFLNSLGTLLSTAETSKQFLPFLNKFKRNYIVVRRAVKKHIHIPKKKIDGEADTAVDGDEIDDGDDSDDVPNLFENLFE